MKIENNLSIEIFNEANSTEFKKVKHNLLQEFEMLHIQTFNYEKQSIFLENRLFLKPKII